jgi:hypothetical protein
MRKTYSATNLTSHPLLTVAVDDPGPFMGVDTANQDQFSVMEFILVVTSQTTLNINMKAEAAGTVSCEEGSVLEFKAVG